MIPALLLRAPLLLLALPVGAQDHSGHQNAAPSSPAVAVDSDSDSDPHAGHVMPGTAAVPDPHAGHNMPAAPADPHAGHVMPGTAAAPDPHAGHNMPAAPADPHASHAMTGATAVPDPHVGHKMPSAATPVGNAAAPPAPADHAADLVWGAGAMAAAREQLRREHGSTTYGTVMLGLVEARVAGPGRGYRWEGEAWFGGDKDGVAFKSEGAGDSKSLESAEVQALYSRALDPYFNLQAGLRYDFKPKPSRAYGVLGIEGLAPYWIEVGAALFVSDKGAALARIEATYDQLLTQRLILQPRVELNFAAQDVPANGIGSGLSTVELGLRLRYEFQREFAPYVGVSWERKIGNTAAFARAAGERVGATSLVIGIRAWF